MLTINMVVSHVLEALDFYEKIFDGKRKDVYHFPHRTGENEGTIEVGHVHLRLIDANADYECHPPKVGEVQPVWLQIVVEDVEDSLQKALTHGAKANREIAEFLGTLSVEITDPFGYTWTIQQVLREVPFEERYQHFVSLQ